MVIEPTVPKIGCSAHMLLNYVQEGEVDSCRRTGSPTDVVAKLKALEPKNRELRQASEILPAAAEERYYTSWTSRAWPRGSHKLAHTKPGGGTVPRLSDLQSLRRGQSV